MPGTDGGGATIVGITGGSGSGKTVLARALVARFCETGAVLLSQDRYYRDRSHLPVAERAVINFDEPGALEMELLVAHLSALRRGTAIDVPTYSYETHCRDSRTVAVAPAPLVIVDGILLFHDPEALPLFDLRVFVDAPADVRLARRVLRDMDERAREVQCILRQYLATVRPMHDRYVEPQRRQAHLVVDNGGALEDAVDRVEAALRVRSTPALERVRPAGL